MPRYVRGGVTVALVPADVLVWRRRFCVELGVCSEAWELGREQGGISGGWVCSLTQHLEALKPSWSRLARSLL